MYIHTYGMYFILYCIILLSVISIHHVLEYVFVSCIMHMICVYIIYIYIYVCCFEAPVSMGIENVARSPGVFSS